MNTITLSILGREILAVRVSQPAQIAPEPAPVEPETEEPDKFGFHGGNGGSHAAGWEARTPRPIDAQ